MNGRTRVLSTPFPWMPQHAPTSGAKQQKAEWSFASEAVGVGPTSRIRPAAFANVTERATATPAEPVRRPGYWNTHVAVPTSRQGGAAAVRSRGSASQRAWW